MSSSRLSQLVALLGERCTIDAETMAAYARDSSRVAPAGKPLALVRAETTADVQAALRWASSARVPVSVRGAGTGLVGGAVAYDCGLILSLERMNRIHEINIDDRLAVVDPGVITAQLDAAARTHGLFFPPDPASAQLSTVGGNIATNAGGLRCIAHGVTQDSIAALEVVLADGRILHTGARTRKNVTGYDLTSLFVGSEGTLGVVTRATVRLLPVPAGIPHTFRANFPTLESAGEAVLRLTRESVQIEALELMDALSVEVIESFFPTGLAAPEGAMLIGQTVGPEAREAAERCTVIASETGATDTEISTTNTLLEARRMSNPALTARGLKVSCDVGVPISQLAAVFSGIEQISRERDVRVSTVAHAGDGNLHSTVEVPLGPGGTERAELVIAEITRLALALDGTVTGEHGIGALRQEELSWQLDRTHRDVLQSVKSALDPHHILTPGRAW